MRTIGFMHDVAQEKLHVRAGEIFTMPDNNAAALVALVPKGAVVDLTPKRLQSLMWASLGFVPDMRHARFFVVGCPECNADGKGSVRLSACRVCGDGRKVLVQ